MLEQIRTYLLIKYFAYKRWLKTKNDMLFFKYFYKRKKREVKIILCDFSCSPLYRKKIIYESCIIDCGIGNLFDNMMKHVAGVDFEVILIINCKDSDSKEEQSKYQLLQNIYPFIKKIILRENIGFDFGAYNEGYQYLKPIDYKGDIVFMNSSASGPYNDYWLLRYSYLFHRRKDIGLCGISLNSHTTHLKYKVFEPHVQSFFLYTSMEVLTSVFPDSIPGADVVLSKEDIISYGEIELSQRVINNGYGICSKLFENFIYYKGNKWKIPTGDLRYKKIYNQFANKI